MLAHRGAILLLNSMQQAMADTSNVMKQILFVDNVLISLAMIQVSPQVHMVQWVKTRSSRGRQDADGRSISACQWDLEAKRPWHCATQSSEINYDQRVSIKENCINGGCWRTRLKAKPVDGLEVPTTGCIT